MYKAGKVIDHAHVPRCYRISTLGFGPVPTNVIYLFSFYSANVNSYSTLEFDV